MTTMRQHRVNWYMGFADESNDPIQVEEARKLDEGFFLYLTPRFIIETLGLSMASLDKWEFFGCAVTTYFGYTVYIHFRIFESVEKDYGFKPSLDSEIPFYIFFEKKEYFEIVALFISKMHEQREAEAKFRNQFDRIRVNAAVPPEVTADGYFQHFDPA